MSVSASWANHFNISDGDRESFLAAHGLSETSALPSETMAQFLSWCIAQGRFSAEEFLAWSSSSTDLPVIRSDYFKTPTDLMFWDSVKDLHPWTSSCLPVAQWDDVLLVGTVFPDVEIRLSRKVRFALAHPNDLSDLYQRFVSPSTRSIPLSDVTQPTPKPPETPKITEGDYFERMSRELGIGHAGEEGNAEEASAGASHDPSTGASEDPKTDPEPEELSFVPDGLKLSPELMARLLKPVGAQEPTVETLPAASIDKYDETLAPGINDLTPTAFEKTPGLPPPPPPPPRKAETVQFPLNPSAAKPDASQIESAAESGSFRSRKLEAPVLTSFFGGFPNLLASDTTPVPTGKHGPSTGFPLSPAELVLQRSIPVNKLDPIHLDECQSVDEVGAQALLQACHSFETAMILLFNDGVLMPWKWSDLFLSVKKNKPDPINLGPVSFFRTVFRTSKPYHGYVVTSEVNQKFFNEFYRGMLPKHLTIVPIMIDGKMAGMLLGCTNTKIEYRQSLRLMERLASNVAKMFKLRKANQGKAS